MPAKHFKTLINAIVVGNSYMLEHTNTHTTHQFEKNFKIYCYIHPKFHSVTSKHRFQLLAQLTSRPLVLKVIYYSAKFISSLLLYPTMH